MRSAVGPVGARNSSGPIRAASHPAQRGQAPSAAEIGALFRDLRRILRLSIPDLAARLGTRLDVIAALERGEISRLPPWPETVRVVTGFTSLARIDPRPVLAIIRGQMEGGATVVGARDARRQPLRSLARATASAARRVAATTRSAASVAWGARGAMAQSWIASEAADMDVEADARHSMAWLGRTGIMVLLVLSLTFATYLARSTGLEGALANLRTPIERLVSKTHDYIVRRTASAPSSDELKWIDVGDPRSRRADRLRTDPR
jgi:transcriptional regulator with XRE-family HTH domain